MKLQATLIPAIAALALIAPLAAAQSDDPMSNRPPRPGQDDRPRPSRAAQGGGQFRELTLEQAKPVWELQVKSVARDVKLNPSHVTQVTEWYIQTRHDLRIATGKLREEMRQQFQNNRPDRGERPGRGGRGGGNNEISFNNTPPSHGNLLAGAAPAIMQDSKAPPTDDPTRPVPPPPPGIGDGEWAAKLEAVANEHRDALKSKLSALLSGTSLNRAMLVLGSFDPRFDQLVFTIGSFKLEDSNQDSAIDAVRDHVALIADARASNDREVIRNAEREAAKQLDAVLSSILNQEQMARIRPQLQPLAGRFAGPEADRPGRFAPPGRGGETMKERLYSLDANGDDRLQFDELPERLQQNFKDWDGNDDGVLDPEEIEAMVKDLQQRFQDAPPRGGRPGGRGGNPRPGDEI